MKRPGRIMPVSILAISSGAATAVRMVKGDTAASIAHERSYVGEMSGHRSGRHHRGTHDVGEGAAALPAFEIAVRRRRAPFARIYEFAVRAIAHRTSGVAPFEPRFDENPIEPFGLRLPFDRTGSRRDHAGHGRAPSLEHRRRGAQVLDARVGARADEDAIDGYLLERHGWGKPHVFDRPLDTSSPVV